MSGHSKWSKIKRQKSVNDTAKSRVFAKLSRMITLAVIDGGGMPDPDLNVKLRLAIEKAKLENLPKENIQRAIEKGSGPDKNVLKEVKYEAFGPAGTAILILATTDNANRTVSDIRNVLERNGGKIASLGAVSYLFQSVGVISLNNKEVSEEKILTLAEEINALDIEVDGEVTTMYVPYDQMGRIKDHVQGLNITGPEHIFKPDTTVQTDKQTEEKVIALIHALDELDDVHEVFTNLDLVHMS